MRQKLFLLTGSFTFGGTERYIYNLVNIIDKKRFDLTVGCMRNEGPLIPIMNKAPVEFSFSGLKKLRKGNLKLMLKEVKGLCALINYVRSERFDIIYATHFQTNFYLALASLFYRKPALVLGYRGLNPFKARLGSLLGWTASKLADRIIVNSKASGETLVNRTGISWDKIRIIYNGVENYYKGFPEKESRSLEPRLPGADMATKKIIGTVGRLHRIKGHEFLIRTFHGIIKNYPEAHLMIVGDGDERKKLENLSEIFGIREKVTFTGFSDKIFSLLKLMDIFVLPSISESFPNALLEAMAAGVPCIATRVGGIIEIIEDRRNGLLVKYGNIHELGNAITMLLDNPQLSRKLALRGLEKASCFTKERMVGQVEMVFEEAISVRMER